MTTSLRLILPDGVVITPVKELPAEVRNKIDCDDDAYAISRPRSRVPTQVVDARFARLLEEFRSPKTIVQAILDFSRTHDTDPHETLTHAHPLFQDLAAQQLLVPEGSDSARVIEPTMQPGTAFGAYEIVDCVRSLNDTELYRARTADGTLVALKVSRTEFAQATLPALVREAAVLVHLEGSVAPRLIERNVEDGRPYLVTEWIEGAPAAARAAEIRELSNVRSRRRLLDVCCRILDVYAELHGHGVLHSDIHPENVLINETDEIRLIDFGLSRLLHADGSSYAPPRGGVVIFYEPEYVRATLDNSPPPASTQLGEQYGLAALCYLLITGEPYLDFKLDRHELMTQIAEHRPRPFTDLGLPPWPEVESLLFKALAKNPSERYLSVSAFAQSMRAALEGTPEPMDTKDAPVILSAASEDFLRTYLERVRPGGALYERGFAAPPYSSFMFGAAGLAYALYRMACIRDDADLLSVSDLWVARSLAGMDSESAFYNPQLELDPELIGRNALFHTASGVHLVATLVAIAQGDPGASFASARAFGEAAGAKTDNWDITLGRVGVLHGYTMLEEAQGANDSGDSGRRVADELWSEVERSAPIPESLIPLNLGVAHGWAGLLFTILRWQRASGSAPAAGIENRLEELASCAQPAGRGVRWPWTDHRSPGIQGGAFMPGWCNGSAGFVFLWTLASEIFAEPAWTRLAERAAWNAWDGRTGPTSLCCGAIGSAYALLNLYRHTGETEWRDRAVKLVDYAMRGTAQLQEQPDSLYKGELGLALLICEMARPEEARMPLFEHEGWPTRLT